MRQIRFAHPARPVTSVTTRIENGQVITRLGYADDSVERFDAEGRKLAPFSDVEARPLRCPPRATGSQPEIRISASPRETKFNRQPLGGAIRGPW